MATQEQRAHPLIAGRPDDSAYMRRLTRLLDGAAARGRVHLPDHRPSPLPLLAAADSFVLPVVLSDVGGAREQPATDFTAAEPFGEGAKGFLVPNPSGSPVLLDWAVMSRPCLRSGSSSST